MHYIRFIIMFIMLSVVVLFGCLNAYFVDLHYFFGQLKIYFPILLFLLFFMGLVFGGLLCLFSIIKKEAKCREQAAALKKLQVEIKNMRVIPLKDELW